MIYKIANAPILEANLDKTSSWRTANVAPSYGIAEDGDWSFEKQNGMLYVAVRAVSVGTNGNGDHFTEEELKKAYKTFIGKGVFVNHASNDIEKKRGKIVDARWVESRGDKYVVTLLEMNEKAYPDFCQMIRSKQIDSVSMGAVYDVGLPHFVTMEDLTVKSYFDLQVGDKVVTHDGSVSEIVAKGKEWHDKRDAYTIKAMKISPVVLSEEHPLLVLRKDDKQKQNAEQFIEAKDIRVGDYLLSNIYRFVHPTEITVQEAQLLGWYLAEGSFCDKTGISFVLNISDPIEEIKNLILSVDSQATVHHYSHTASKNAVNLVFYSKHIRELIENNVKGDAKTKQLSQTILDMEPEKQLALVGSYIDGDGCVAKSYRKNRNYKPKSLHITTASEQLASQISLICERLNILPSVQSVNRKPGKNSVVKKPFMEHTIHIGASYVFPLRNVSQKANSLAEVEKPIYKSFVYGNYVATPVTSVKKTTYTGWAYNIQVSSTENPEMSGNHSYHLNGIASHNCQVAFSECSICHHKAKTTANYCFHVKMHKGGAYDGRPVFEINKDVEFIEVSWVTVGADPQAKLIEIIARQKGLDFQQLLQKAASGNQFFETIESSVEKVGIETTILQGIRYARQQRETK